MKYLFGPVNSRRLGISLGIDLVPFKTCTLDCVYCECGRTTNLTIKRDEYVPTSGVITELDEFLAPQPNIDIITFAGSGEPTLHSGVGVIIRHLKKRWPQYRVAVLTNGTLFFDADVREALLLSDMVIPSLDAVGEETFNSISRPAPGITPERVVEGLVAFRAEYRGDLVLEIFIVPGYNDTEEELTNLKEASLRIKPDRIQINSLDRPGTEEWVRGIDKPSLFQIKEFFTPLKVDLINAPIGPDEVNEYFSNTEEAVVSTLKRRPSTLEDLHSSLGIKRPELLKIIWHLKERGIIVSVEEGRGEFFRLS